MEINEILEAVTATPDLAVKIFENITKLPNGDQFIANANKAYFDENVGKEISKIYNGIDEDLFTITGKRKSAEQKTYDFVKEIVTSFKTLAEENSKNTPEEVKKFKETIATLEEKVKNGESSSHWKKSYEEAMEELKNNSEKHRKELETVNSRILQTNVDTDIIKGLTDLKFNESLPKTVIDAMVNQAKGSLIANAKIIEGKVIYHDAEGKILRNLQYENATAKELLEVALKDILAVGKQGGGGAPPTGKGEVITTGTGDSTKLKLVLDAKLITSKTKFNELAEKAMFEKGLARGSKEWREVIDGAYKEYGVDKLERI